MSDVSTAATMNALNEERLKLRCDVQALQAMYDERREYAERLLAENVRLSNEAAFMRSFINNEDVRSDFQTVTAMRQALDRERERCGVLEREVLAWHAAEHLRKDEPHAEFMRLAEARARTRETHALDPAKFEVKP